MQQPTTASPAGTSPTPSPAAAGTTLLAVAETASTEETTTVTSTTAKPTASPAAAGTASTEGTTTVTSTTAKPTASPAAAGANSTSAVAPPSTEASTERITTSTPGVTTQKDNLTAGVTTSSGEKQPSLMGVMGGIVSSTLRFSNDLIFNEIKENSLNSTEEALTPTALSGNTTRTSPSYATPKLVPGVTSGAGRPSSFIGFGIDHLHGLFAWGIFLVRRLTGTGPEATTVLPNVYQTNLDHVARAEALSIRSHALVTGFMDAVQKQVQASSMEEATSAVFDNFDVYNQAMHTVRSAEGLPVDGITALLFEQIVQNNIHKIAATATSDQMEQFLANVREVLPKLGQQFLQQEGFLQNQFQEETPSRNQAPNISLLTQAMCSMPQKAQLADVPSQVNASGHPTSTLVPGNGTSYRGDTFVASCC